VSGAQFLAETFHGPDSIGGVDLYISRLSTDSRPIGQNEALAGGGRPSMALTSGIRQHYPRSAGPSR
jgi:hypothetical protein